MSLNFPRHFTAEVRVFSNLPDVGAPFYEARYLVSLERSAVEVALKKEHFADEEAASTAADLASAAADRISWERSKAVPGNHSLRSLQGCADVSDEYWTSLLVATDAQHLAVRIIEETPAP